MDLAGAMRGNVSSGCGKSGSGGSGPLLLFWPFVVLVMNRSLAVLVVDV
jgi:hypothetical protein